MPVAAIVAQALGVPMDVLVVRKIGAPSQPELVPVAAHSTVEGLRSCFDDVVCLSTPSSFGSVGQHYSRFDQVSVARVRQLLAGPPA